MRTSVERVLVVALGLVLTGVGQLRAQDAHVRVRADTSVITVGDPIVFDISVEHDPGWTVQWPDSLDLLPFEVLRAETLPVQEARGRRVSPARLVLTAFELGELEIPSLEIPLVNAEGTEATVETDPWGVEVRSVGLDEGGDIRAIKGPLTMAMSVVSVLPWILLALAVAGVGVWWWRRRRPEPERDYGPVVLPRPAHEVALEALSDLERAGYLERGSFKEYHVRLAEIVRVYLGDRYDIHTLEMTSGEVVDALWRVGIEGEILERFRRFLERADLVKFAKFEPTSADSRALLEEARALVEETRSRMLGAEDGEGPAADEDGATGDEEE